MKNLLPQFKTFKVDDGGRKPKHSKWQPGAADPKTAVIPYYLTASMKPESTKVFRESKDTNTLAPNKKYLGDVPYSSTEPSPLSLSERGIADAKTIDTRAVIKERRVVEDLKERNLRNSLFIWMQNNLAVENDIFVQSAGKMNSSCIEAYGGVSIEPICGGIKGKAPEDHQICNILIATNVRSVIVVTGNQDVRDFAFESGPIGLEVETSGTKLICSKVLENSQAEEKYGVTLLGSTVIAVNGSRVLTLNEFTRALVIARTTGSVVLTAAVFRGSVGRAAALKEHAFEKRNLHMKATFSSLLKGGIDKDHQHGIELPSQMEEEEDDDSSSEEDETSAETTKPLTPQEKAKAKAKAMAAAKATAAASKKAEKLDEDHVSAKSNKQEIAEKDTDGDFSPLGRPPRSPSPAQSKATSRKDQARMTSLKIKEIEETVRQRSESMLSASSRSRSRTPTPMRSPTPNSERSSALNSTRSSTPDDIRMEFMSSFKFKPAHSEDEEKDIPARGSFYDQEDGTVQRKEVGISFTNEDQDGMLAGVRVIRAVRVADDELAPLVDSENEDDEEEVAQEEVMTEPDVDAKEEAIDEKEEEEVEEEEEAGWDYATALENAERMKFLRVVCWPGQLSRSLEWGNPTFFIQFSNFSKYWDINVYWVDEDCSLIHRKLITGGDKHVEMTSESHVWVLSVSSNTAAHKRNALHDLLDESNDERKQKLKAEGVGSDVWAAEEERQDRGALTLALRPAATSLLQDRCTNMLWVPWRSLTVGQRSHPPSMPIHKLPQDRRTFLELNGAPINPHMHIQVLDIPAARRPGGSNAGSTTNSVAPVATT